MIEMFKLELAMAIDSENQPLVTFVDCVERAMRVDYRLTKVKEERAQFFKARREEKTNLKQNEDHKNSQGDGPNNHFGPRNQYNSQSNNDNNTSYNNKKRRKPNGNQSHENRNVQQRANNYTPHLPCETCGKNHPGNVVEET